jgi:hypothetical protein
MGSYGSGGVNVGNRPTTVPDDIHSSPQVSWSADIHPLDASLT